MLITRCTAMQYTTSTAVCPSDLARTALYLRLQKTDLAVLPPSVRHADCSMQQATSTAVGIGYPSNCALSDPDRVLCRYRQIFSGAVHYFRVHPAYWRTTLRKLRAAGLNTVETYVAWNLHEPQVDVYDFGGGGNDMSEFLDLAG